MVVERLHLEEVEGFRHLELLPAVLPVAERKAVLPVAEHKAVLLEAGLAVQKVERPVAYQQGFKGTVGRT